MINEEKGFSLLEISIVLVIIGAIFAIAGRGMFDKKANTRKVMRDFLVAGKDLRSRAKLNGTTYRLAFQLDKNANLWWVEKSSQASLVDKKKLDEERESSKQEKNSSEEKKASDFQPDTSIFKKKQELPKGFRFKHIESALQDAVVTEGMAYIHFFSQGLIETSAIQIEDPKKNIWTLIYNPITGQTDILPEEKLLKDLSR